MNCFAPHEKLRKSGAYVAAAVTHTLLTCRARAGITTLMFADVFLTPAGISKTSCLLALLL